MSTTYYKGSGQKKNVPTSIFIYLVYYKLCLSFEVWEECESLRALQRELMISIPSCLLVNMTIGLSFSETLFENENKKS